MAKPPKIPRQAFFPGLVPAAQQVAALLDGEGLLTEDVASTLAQAHASNPRVEISLEQLLLCLVSDYMRPFPIGKHPLFKAG